MNSKKKILVIEDDRTIAQGLRALLQSEGFTAQAAFNGEDGFARTFRSHPDLIILDVSLPRMNGLQVCRQLRSRGIRTPIIMLTARSGRIDTVIGLEAGADDYVAKPFDPHEVIARVRAHLRRAESPPTPGTSGAAEAAHSGEGRKLLSVMFTDMMDFSRKMNEDEAAAIGLLKRHTEWISRAVKQHDGRVIEIIGDAFLASFESALHAVKCGISIQQQFRRYNRRKGHSRQLHERIGIHLGDVIEIDGKLRGDTVNIAARLQQLATPDDVYVSESVFQATTGKIVMNATRFGRRKVKNIREPITVYRITV